MSYNPGQGHHVGARIPSGIAFFGTDATDPVYMANSSFIIDDVNSYLEVPKIKVDDGGTIGSQTTPDAMTIATNGDVTLSSDLSITGNLTVNGTTTTVNSTTVTIEDPIIILGSGSPTVDDNKDRGISFNYYNGTALKGFFGYDDSEEKFTFMTGVTISSEVVSGTVGTIKANLQGNVNGNASTATALASSQNFSLTGEVVATNVSFNGTGPVQLSTTLHESAISGQGEISATGVGDYMLIWDATSSDLKKISIDNFGAGNMNNFGIAGDTGTADITDGETITFAGSTGLDTSVTGNTVTYTLDISEYSTVAVGAGDSFLMLDNDGTTEQRSTVTQLGAYLAGDNITNTNGVLSVADSDIEAAIFTAANFVDSATIDFTVTAGASVTAVVKSTSIDGTHLASSVAGSGLVLTDKLHVGEGSLIDVTEDAVSVDLTEAAAATIANGDYLIFLDGGTAGAASKGSTVDLATLLAGTVTTTGIDSSGSTLAVQYDNSSINLNGSGQLQVKAGGVTEAMRVRTVASPSATGNITTDIVLASGGLSGITLTLPTAASGKMVIVKKTDSAAGTVTVLRNGSATIDGSTQKILYAQYESMTFVSDGTNWFIV